MPVREIVEVKMTFLVDQQQVFYLLRVVYWLDQLEKKKFSSKRFAHSENQLPSCWKLLNGLISMQLNFTSFLSVFVVTFSHCPYDELLMISTEAPRLPYFQSLMLVVSSVNQTRPLLLLTCGCHLSQGTRPAITRSRLICSNVLSFFIFSRSSRLWEGQPLVSRGDNQLGMGLCWPVLRSVHEHC